MKTAQPQSAAAARPAEAAMLPTSCPEKLRLVTAKDLLWLAYLYPLRFLAAMLPARVMHLVGRLLAPIYQIIVQGKKRDAVSSLAAAFGAGCQPAELESITRRFVGNAVFRAIDDLMLSGLKDRSELRCLEIRGLEHVRKAQAAGNGAMLVTGHFHASRIAKCYLAACGYPMLTVRNFLSPDASMGRLGKKLGQPRYSQFLRDLNQDEVSPDDLECSLKILGRLRSGGLVNMHLDVQSERTFFRFPFLGTEWPFSTGFLRIVQMSRCAVIPMLCLGDSRGFRILFDEPFELDYDCGDRFVSVHLPKLLGKLEWQILQHPDQWEFWVRL